MPMLHFQALELHIKKTETYSQTEIDTSLNFKNDVITTNALGTGSELLNSNTLKKLRPTTGSKISVGVDTDSNIEIGCDLTDYYTSTQVDNIITTRNNTFNITGQASYVYMGTNGFWIRDSTDTSTVFACDDDNVGLYKEIVLTSSSTWAGPHNRIPYNKQEVDDLLTTRNNTF